MPTRPARTIIRKKYAMGPCGHSQYWLDKARPPPGRLVAEHRRGSADAFPRILVPLEDVLPAELVRPCLAYYVAPLEKDPLYSRAALSYPQQQLIRGALMHSADDVAAASETMQGILRVRTDEGIQRDFSFHQHGPQLYNGGYGLTLVSDMCNYANVLRDTRYAFARDKLMLLADHLLEGSGHMIRGKMLDYSAFGRTLLRRGRRTECDGIHRDVRSGRRPAARARGGAEGA